MALVTDGRFSGASHGIMIGHLCPEAAHGGASPAPRAHSTRGLRTKGRAAQQSRRGEWTENKGPSRRGEWTENKGPRCATLPSFSPSAAAGPLAIVRDGDVISIDLVRRTVDLELAPAEIAARQAACHCPPPMTSSGFPPSFRD